MSSIEFEKIHSSYWYDLKREKYLINFLITEREILLFLSLLSVNKLLFFSSSFIPWVDKFRDVPNQHSNDGKQKYELLSLGFFSEGVKNLLLWNK